MPIKPGEIIHLYAAGTMADLTPEQREVRTFWIRNAWKWLEEHPRHDGVLVIKDKALVCAESTLVPALREKATYFGIEPEEVPHDTRFTVPLWWVAYCS